MAEGYPEQPVQCLQLRPWPFPLQRDDLLSEGEDFEGGIASTTEEDSDGDDKGEDDCPYLI
jgi:hypothetical protein